MQQGKGTQRKRPSGPYLLVDAASLRMRVVVADIATKETPGERQDCTSKQHHYPLARACTWAPWAAHPRPPPHTWSRRDIKGAFAKVHGRFLTAARLSAVPSVPKIEIPTHLPS